MTEVNKQLFRDITGEDEDPEIMEIESLCPNCEEQGLTRLFLTRIPFFQDVIVSSFSCGHCNHRNAELQPASKIQDYGVLYTTRIKTLSDINRQIVQTNYATIKIPELKFEIPPHKGALTTIEGIIEKAVEGLLQDQPVRKIMHPNDAAQIDEFVNKLLKLKEIEEPFTVIVDDPSGNSFVENPHAPSKDPDMKVHHYKRSQTQNEALGLFNEDGESNEMGLTSTGEIDKDEIMKIQSNCPNCNAICSIHMKRVEVPNFKEVVIMACNCDACGYRDNEVKSGSGIEPKGMKITLHITNIDDMKRDLLKSDTCSICIPELEFETGIGTLGGKFTTVEGLLSNVRDQLSKSHPFIFGDSSTDDSSNKLDQFCKLIDEIMEGKRLNVHLILDDPAGNSYLENPSAPEEDPNMKIEHYERSFEQKEELGLNDMKTEDY